MILFAFMEHGISSLREVEKLCRTDIRYMYLLDDMKTPSFATFGNLIRNELTTSIEEIYFSKIGEIEPVIFQNLSFFVSAGSGIIKLST